MPHAYGYLRQAFRKEMPIEWQQRQIDWMYHKLSPEYIWRGYYTDTADVRNIPFHERPVGMFLNVLLEPGDVLLALSLRTVFASVPELRDKLTAWHERGIRVRIERSDIDTSQLGDDAFRCLDAATRLATDAHSETTTLALAACKAAGKPVNQHAGLGFNWETKRGTKVRVVDRDERQVMAEIVRLRDEGATWRAIYFEFLKERRKSKLGREWSIMRIHRAYQAEKKLREEEARQQD